LSKTHAINFRGRFASRKKEKFFSKK